MTWTKAFDAGACNVSASIGGTLAWEGVLAKGEESPAFAESGKAFQVSVSASGEVELSCNTEDASSRWRVTCTPLYALNGAELRGSNVSAFGAGAGAGGAWFSDDQFESISMAFDDAGAGTPNPVTSAEVANALYVSIEAAGAA